MAVIARPRRTRRDQPADALGPVAAQRRHAFGLTQRDLALLADVSERSVQALEAGKSTVRLDIVMKILDALGLTLAVLPKSHGRRLANMEKAVLLSAHQPRRSSDTQERE